jgi:hypothetical protein
VDVAPGQQSVVQVAAERTRVALSGREVLVRAPASVLAWKVWKLVVEELVAAAVLEAVAAALVALVLVLVVSVLPVLVAELAWATSATRSDVTSSTEADGTRRCHTGRRKAALEGPSVFTYMTGLFRAIARVMRRLANSCARACARVVARVGSSTSLSKLVAALALSSCVPLPRSASTSRRDMVMTCGVCGVCGLPDLLTASTMSSKSANFFGSADCSC